MAGLDLQTERLLCALQDAGVRFAVIGGVAAVAHGASTPTQDLDVAAAMEPENVRRLLAALKPFRPRHVLRPDLGVITDEADVLSRYRMLLIDTDLGRIDVLASVEPIGSLDALETVEMELVAGRRFEVISLDQLIEVKASLSRPKDRTVETELRAIRDLLGSSGN